MPPGPIYDDRVRLLSLLAALAAGPSAPRAAPLVDATSVVAGLRIDLRYATAANLTGKPLYSESRCLLRPDVAAALARAQAALAREGYGLLAWDCYRPLSAQRALWRVCPHPGLVANPRTGSNHNRGAAIDLTLVDRAGRPVEMPTPFDSFDAKARQGATEGVPAAAQRHREILRRAMVAAGFTTIRKEWWHYDFRGALKDPLLDVKL